MLESAHQAAIRLALAERGDNVFWSNPGGKATHYKGGCTCPTCGQKTLNARKFVVPYGLQVGSSDLIGMVPVEVSNCPHDGLDLSLAAFVGLEVKTGRGRESAEQKLYHNLVNEKGGVVRVVRSVKDAHDVVDQIRRLEPWLNHQHT